MHISLTAETLFHIGSFPVTNTLITAWIAVLFLLVVAFLLRRNLREVPRGLQNVVEAAVEAMLNLMDAITGDRKQSVRFFPLIATLFFFILTANWIGLLPGVGSLGFHVVEHGEEVLVPFFRSANSDLNVTLALAIVSVFSIQMFGIMAIGFFRYMGKFINLKNPIMTFVGVVELISEVARLISFSFRLFGNVFAGEVLLVVVASLVPLIAPLPFYFLEVFVGFIQAFVFAILTLVFLKVATVETHA